MVEALPGERQAQALADEHFTLAELTAASQLATLTYPEPVMPSPLRMR